MAEATTEAPVVDATTASTVATTAAPESATAATTTPATETTATTAVTEATTTEAKPADGKEAPKPGDKPATETPKPEEVVYEFKVPEGVKLDGEALDAVKATAKEFGLTAEQAQKVVDLGVKQAQAFQTQMAEHSKQVAEQWATDTKNDKEFGGDKLPENLATAKRALDTFGTPELKKLLNDSGLGNHPEIIRVFVKAGKAISEDGKLITGSAGNPARADKPIENRLYPNQK